MPLFCAIISQLFFFVFEVKGNGLLPNNAELDQITNDICFDYYLLISTIIRFPKEKKYVASFEVRIQSPLRETYHTGHTARISSD